MGVFDYVSFQFKLSRFVIARVVLFVITRAKPEAIQKSCTMDCFAISGSQWRR